MTFHVGQKVVCITDDWSNPEMPWLKPKVAKGKIYTINDIDDCQGWPALRFYEVIGCYHADGFRPIVEKKTDISIFTAMLKPKKVKADA